MTSQIKYNKEDIVQIVKAQRSLVKALSAILLINLTCWLFKRPIVQSIGINILFLFPLNIFIAGFYTFRLDRTLKGRIIMSLIAAVLAGFLAFTFIGLLVMGMVSSRATSVLKQQGLKVGFMGVSQRNFDRWQSTTQTK